MIAHVAFPALEPDSTKIATTSRHVVSGLLREQLGFKGVIVSDAMEMKGLTKVFLRALVKPPVVRPSIR
jgi:beta-N-acetylhexosaminidase